MKALRADFAALPAFMARLPHPAMLALMFAGLALGWWIYVPVHELLHVAGCVLAGGEVSRLEIATIYGGTWLAALFPFVQAGSDYAGRLTGFDTGGSDLVYQATVLAPYLLTVFPGLWWWRTILRARRPGARHAIAAGAWLPVVAAPLISLPGDYYESGSIIVSALLAGAAGRDPGLWRSDDVFRLIGEWSGPMTAPDVIGIVLGVLAGTALALATLALGSALGARLASSGNRLSDSTEVGP